MDSTQVPWPASALVKRGETDVRQYRIVELSDGAGKDVMYLPRWKREIFRFIPLSGAVPTLLGLWYAIAQAITLEALSRSTSSPVHIFTRSGRVELSGLVPVFAALLTPLSDLFLSFRFLMAVRGKPRPRLRLTGDVVPAVDIIITVCNEPFDVIQATVLATLAVDYPKDRLRVLIADDGFSLKLGRWSQHQKLTNANLWYTARDKRGPAGYKAGNLNHALQFLEALPGGPSNLTAGLDADMAPETRWLRHVVPHLIKDPLVGVVCPAQHFYNCPPGDPLYQSQALEWRCFDVLRDFCESALNTGSGWVARRQALDNIGGFSEHHLGEDVFSSVLMMREGWKTVYLPESLQYGLMPEGYEGHLKQFTRWHTGACQTAISMRFFLSSRFTKHMTIGQRWTGACQAVDTFFSPIAGLLALCANCAWFITGAPLVLVTNITEIRYFLRLQSVIVISGFLADAHVALVAGYHISVRSRALRVWMAPYYIINMVRLLLPPSPTEQKKPSFIPSGSIDSSMYERHPDRRLPLHTRLRMVLFRYGAWVHLLFVILTITAVVVRGAAAFTFSKSVEDMLIRIVVSIAWPPLNWVLLNAACLAPIQYIIWPPSNQGGGKKLGWSKTVSGFQPVQTQKSVMSNLYGLRYPQLYTMSVIYSVVVLTASFVI